MTFMLPLRIWRKTSRVLKEKLLGEIPTWHGEDFDKHWNYTSFVGKTVLDLGADYGSTAHYFLKKGATRIIAVEGDPELASKLEQNYQNNSRVKCIKMWIQRSDHIVNFIRAFKPDLAKVDIEGSESVLLNINPEVLKMVKEWLIEIHSDELYGEILDFLNRQGFNVSLCYTAPDKSMKVILAHQRRIR